MREYSGRHEYDGQPQDLSPDGVRAGLARLAAARAGGERTPDPHDEAQLAAAEDATQVALARLEQHRRNPLRHLGEFDLAATTGTTPRRRSGMRRGPSTWPPGRGSPTRRSNPSTK